MTVLSDLEKFGSDGVHGVCLEFNSNVRKYQYSEFILFVLQMRLLHLYQQY